MLPSPPPPTTEAVWATFHQEMQRFVLRRVRQPEAAQDLLQDIFVKIHLRLATLTQTERLAAWVYQIARNTVLDHFRQHHPTTDSVEDVDPLPAALEQSTPLDFTPCVQPFLSRLPVEFREALQLTELEGISQKDYAARLGISYSGAKSRVQRARRQLHELFMACCRIEADSYGNILAAQPRNACGCQTSVEVVCAS